MLQEIILFGQYIKLYDLFNNLATVAAILLAFTVYAGRYKEISTLPALASARLFKKKDGFFAKWLFVLVEFLSVYLLASIPSGAIGNLISQVFLQTTDANFFTNIFYSPVAFFLLALLFKVSPLKLLDIVAVLTNVTLIFFKLACYFEGCCYGVQIPETSRCIVPFYNYREEQYQLPIQLIEMALAVIILAVLLLLRRQKDKKPGIIFPVFTLLYSGTRFVSEFWRADYPARFGRLTGYHVQCLLGVGCGVIGLVIVLLLGQRLTDFFEAKNKAFLEKKLAAFKKKKADTRHTKQ